MRIKKIINLGNRGFQYATSELAFASVSKESSCKNEFRTQVHFYERFCTNVRFETEAQRNSEKAYQVQKVISQLQKGKWKEFLVVVQEDGNFCKGTLLYLFEV